MVGEECVIELGQDSHLMRIFVNLSQVFPMFVQCSSLVPPLSDTRVILPFVEQSKMLRILVVKRENREKLVQVWDVPTVYTRSSSWLRRSDGMEGVYTTFRKSGGHDVLARPRWIATQWLAIQRLGSSLHPPHWQSWSGVPRADSGPSKPMHHQLS